MDDPQTGKCARDRWAEVQDQLATELTAADRNERTIDLLEGLAAAMKRIIHLEDEVELLRKREKIDKSEARQSALN